MTALLASARRRRGLGWPFVVQIACGFALADLAGCGPSTGMSKIGSGDDTRGATTVETSGASMSTTSATTPGENTSGTDAGGSRCPDSPFPEPYCFREYDVSDVLAKEYADALSHYVGPPGRYGPDDRIGLALVEATRGSSGVRRAVWDAESASLLVSPTTPPPRGTKLAHGDGVLYPIPALTIPDGRARDALILWSFAYDPAVLAFAPGTDSFGAPSTLAVISPPRSPDLLLGSLMSSMALTPTATDAAVDVRGDVWQLGASGWAYVARLPWDAADPGAPQPTSYRQAVVATDLDHDGRDELLLLDEPKDRGSRHLWVVQNTTGTAEGFAASHVPVPFEDGHPDDLGNARSSVAAGDLDGDGHQDVLLVRLRSTPRSGVIFPARFFVYFGRGDGTLEDGLELASGTEDVATTDLFWVLDLDGDGADEISTSGFSSGHSVVTDAREGGSVVPLAAEPTWFLGIADLDSDGRVDMLTDRRTLLISE